MSMWIPQISQASDEEERDRNNLIMGLALHVLAAINVLIAIAVFTSPAPFWDACIGLGIGFGVELLIILGVWAMIVNGF